MLTEYCPLCRLSKAVCAGVGSVSGYRGLVGPSKPGSELASRHVRSIASGLGNTTYNNCTFLLYSTDT